MNPQYKLDFIRMAMILVNLLTRCAPDEGKEDSDGTKEPEQKKSKRKKKHEATGKAGGEPSEEAVVADEWRRDNKSPRSVDSPPGQTWEKRPPIVRGCPFLGTTEERRARYGTAANGYGQEEPEAGVRPPGQGQEERSGQGG